MLADQLTLNDSVEFVENLFTKTLSVYDEQQFINDLFKIPEQPSLSEVSTKAANVASAEGLSAKHSLTFDPVFSGSISIGIKTQIQTNRRTNIYLDSSWPEDLVNKKLPIHYFPPNDESIYDKIKNVEEPSQLWMTELSGNPYGQLSYVEVQYWMKNQDGKMQLISKCGTHPSLIKMNGQPYEEKAISHEEVKWSRNTMIFGVNFNCTRTCFKSEIYMFIRVRVGNSFFESGIIELPFRRSEKRKHDNCMDTPRASKRQILKQIPKVIHPPSPSSKPIVPLLNISQLSGSETKITQETPISIKSEPIVDNHNDNVETIPSIDINTESQVMDMNFGDKQTVLPLFSSPSVSYDNFDYSPNIGFESFNVDFDILNVDSWDPD